MAEITTELNWKSLYASNIHDWQQTTLNGRQVQYRRLGVVENLFDLDGIDYEGRADLNMNSTIELKTQLTDDQLQRRIALVWTYMRLLHPLLACKSLYREDFLPDASGRKWIDKCFLYEKPADRQDAMQDALRHLTFVQDAYPNADFDDFYTHLLNTGRAVDAKVSLSRLFVMPFKRAESGSITLSIVIVAGHEVADGLTVFRLSISFIDMLNMREQDLISCVDAVCSDKGNAVREMPPPQESLYPVYASNIARDRWNWAISRILRHVRRPLPACFQNPLLRQQPLQGAAVMPEKYSQILDYTKVPPLNGSVVWADLSPRATGNLIKLCRQARISIGSGAFTLVGMVMMRFEEATRPEVSPVERLPFIGSFPVNPRPFLSGPSTTGKEDSLMLAFSDGVVLPFVTSDLDFAKAFRVLGRLAHRQLRQYQKRKPSATDKPTLGSRSPQELLPSLYLSTIERLESRVKPDQRVGFNPQKAYPPRQSPTLATCGISSVGDRRGLLVSVGSKREAGTSDLEATFQDLRSAVRPRDGEFLVGAIGTGESMQFRVSCDGSAIDPGKADAWRVAIQSILDFDMDIWGENIIIPLSSTSIVPKHAKL